MIKIVGTPIGNLQDLSLRQANSIMSADIVLAENTSSAGTLLQQIPELFPDIKRNQGLRVIGFHKDNEYQKLSEVLDLLEDDKNIVLISEAGMPTISDPGHSLIKHLIKKGITFEIVPGPTAATTALVYSGFDPTQHMFLGFLPKKEAELKKVFEMVRSIHVTALQQTHTATAFIFYESPHRINKTLAVLADLLPDADVVIGRELTKKFEEILRGKPVDLKDKSYKGELTLVLRLSTT